MADAALPLLRAFDLLNGTFELENLTLEPDRLVRLRSGEPASVLLATSRSRSPGSCACA